VTFKDLQKLIESQPDHLQQQYQQLERLRGKEFWDCSTQSDLKSKKNESPYSKNSKAKDDRFIDFHASNLAEWT
jgi:hypothetical protein